MGAIQYRECHLCGKTTGARFIDEALPCPYCKNNVFKAEKIKKQDRKENIIMWIGLFMFVFVMFFIMLCV